MTGRRPRRPPEPPIIEDSYEPGDVEQAWREHCEAHGWAPYPRDDRYSLFRSGWRRGFGQGTVMGITTIVHTYEAE